MNRGWIKWGFLLVVYGCGETPTDPERYSETIRSEVTALKTDVQCNRKVVLCHRPPGHPQEQHEIIVEAHAAGSHIAHGDSVGLCVRICDRAMCDDGDPCTADDCSTSGECTHAAVDCNDGNPCTLDTCSPGVGCTSANAPASVGCDDGNDCTAADVCRDGTCRGGAIPECCLDAADCEDGDVCTRDACVAHACSNEAVVCTTADRCLAPFCDPALGRCSTASISCDDGNVCTDDSCAPQTGCVHQPTQAPPQSIEANCHDGIDNDCDGLTDELDPNCAAVCQVTADVIFVLEESDAVAGLPFTTERNAVSTIASGLDFGISSVHAGVVGFATAARTVLSLTASRTSLVAAVNDMAPVGGGSREAIGLERAQALLATTGRSDAQPIVVLLSDGNFDSDPSSAAISLKAAGVVLFTIGLTEGAAANLAPLASTVPGTVTSRAVGSLADLSSALAAVGVRCSSP